MKTRPLIAVYSQVASGHVPAYHRLYREQFAAAGCDVLDLPPVPVTWSAGLTGQLDRWPRWRGRRAWRRAAARVRIAERAAGRAVDGAFLVYLDLGFLEAAIGAPEVDAWFPHPWAGVVNAPLAVRQASRPFAGGERVLAATQCRAVVVTDGEFVPACRAAWPGRDVLTMPEVADLSAPSRPAGLRELADFARGRRLVGSVGVFGAKKNIPALLALARQAEAALPDVAFFIAGDFSPRSCPGPERRALQRALRDFPRNVAVFPEPIADGPDFNAWVSACDVVWLAYRDVAFKSNVLTKAAHFRKPVLVSPGRVMAAHVVGHRLGEVVDPDDTAGTLSALRRLLDSDEEARDFAGFAARNAASALEATVDALVQKFRRP